MVKTILFPAVAFLLTCLLACKQNNREQSPATSYCDLIRGSDTSGLNPHLRIYDSLLQLKSAAYVLEDGDGSMIARAWLTQNASKSIDIQYFIFSVDNVGLIACDYLVRAADRGVKIRILVDDIMVEAQPEDILTMDNHPNIDIKIYNPGTNIGKNIFQKVVGLTTNFRGVNQRMHNKTFIVDQQAVITGGRNIADEYFDYDHEYNFRDRDIFLLGTVVSTVQKSFEMFWNHNLSVPVNKLLGQNENSKNDTLPFEKLHEYACDSMNYWPQVRARVARIPEAFKDIADSRDLIWTDSIEFISDDPGKNDGTNGLAGSGKSTEALIDLLNKAEHSIDIQSPYLVTTEWSRKLFSEAVRRGVQIRILTNSLASTDNLEAFSGYQRDRKKLLETGVRIYEFRPDAACRYKVMTGALQKKLNYTPTFGLHAKTMVVDGKTTVVGTFNLDPRSANLNTECITIVRNAALSGRVLKKINEEFLPENAWETTQNWNPDHLVSRKKRAGVVIRKVVPKSIL